MHPSHLLFSIFIVISILLRCHANPNGDDQVFAYDSIRIRDEPDDHRDRMTQRYDPNRPNRRPVGGSRYLNRRRRPGRKQLDKSSLMVLMGDDYLTSWMSDERPKKPLINVPSNEVNLDDGQAGSWAQERLLNQLRSVNLTAELSEMAPGLLPFENMVRQWMVKRSSCPVEFTWKDLGPTYWPRWIRKGECANRKGLCSYPTGMHCVPGATTKVMLLFWDCEEKKRNRHVRTGTTGVEVKTNVRYRSPVPKLPELMTSGTKKEPEKSARDKSVLEFSPTSSRVQKIAKRFQNFEASNPVLSSRVKRSSGIFSSKISFSETSSRKRVKRNPGGFDAETSVLYKNRVPHLPPSTHIKKKRRCDWKKVPYPITVDCFCTC
ncbi:hypothetical protein JTE90_004877 [Oedothorax gibbosus]|uniref:Noggin n=1 Tax=Oedothorax gibbosus TaxID=931172 RepID=A0AAV6US20_9ARAC|nr:hypothetical protein JTE90_004877 [Oedothorax gibbosus]